MTKKKIKKSESARERILDVAGEVFGKKGYKAATVREICQTAGVNLAAVNYYFGNKQDLYREVTRDLMSRAFKRYPIEPEDMDRKLSPEKRLEFFVKAALNRLLSPEGILGTPGKGKLVAKELADPSPVLEDMVDTFILPQATIMRGIISELLGPGAPAHEIVKCQMSLIGQCFHYATARPIVSRLFPELYEAKDLVEQVSQHITRFSLAGISAIRKAREEN